jgi:SSS family solute:Na+ symporter
MEFFAAADWIVIVVYMFGIVGLGVWFGRGQKTTRDYFLGGRDIPWVGVAFSILATETSALTFIGVPAMAFGGDLTFIQIIVGYVLARVVLAVVMVPHYFKGDVYSPYQLFDRAFGRGAKRTVSVFFLLAGTLAAGVRVYATCIPIEMMLKDALPAALGDPILQAIVIFVGLALIYTYFGGIRAVVWTDAVQFCLLIGGGVFALVYLSGIEGAGWAYYVERGGTEGKLKWFDGSFSWTAPFNIWMGVIGATFQVLSSHGVDQLNVQRVLACKDVRDGRRALILSAVLILPMFLLFLLVGGVLWAYAQVHGLEVPLNAAGAPRNDHAFPLFILTMMPAGVKGLLVVGILSAAMSSVSSALSALSSVSTMDLLKELKPDRSDEWYLRLSRRSTLIWGVALIAVAYGCKGHDRVINVAFSLAGITSGGMLGGLVLVLWWKRGPGLPVIAGMLASLAVMTGVKLWSSIYWPWYTMIGCAVCVGVAFCLRGIVSAGDEKSPPVGP